MDATTLASCKQSVVVGLKHLWEEDRTKLAAVLARLYTEDATCSVAHPVNDLFGHDAIARDWWQPLRTALPDGERRDSIVLAGESSGTTLVGACGHYQGTFAAPLLGIAPTGGVVMLRYGELHAVQDGLITRSWLLVDFLDLMRQANCWPLPPSLGTEATWPAPLTQTGLTLDRVDSQRGFRSLAVVQAMHAALLSFDGHRLDSMDHAKYWTEHFMWYGPGGIGTTRGLHGFCAHHQIPFLRALPDRSGGTTLYIGDGDYTMNCGWPGMQATHTGGDWLGLAPTGRHFTIRVMDFYRVEGDLIAENWVPIDILDVLHQLGVDVFARVRHRNGHPRLIL
jgi:predicted ester cyclase